MYRTFKANYRHEASRGLSARAELLAVGLCLDTWRASERTFSMIVCTGHESSKRTPVSSTDMGHRDETWHGE